MQYDVKNSDEYLELLEDDWRKEKLLAIREMILDYAPELEEVIRYKMLNYGKDDNYVLALNAQKHYVSLYVGTIDKVENAESLLEGYNYGKGCIRVKKSIKVEDTDLEQFIHKTLDMWRAGEDIDC
ncbi:iron chaperone [Fredinandcohnia sp. FSL W7-1320]|uniref:iron chaperone n=1 Tax=Fredinandcohnia sp. FSL W7-1320 TaxID=2954540 RepID=UPI0030FD887B